MRECAEPRVPQHLAPKTTPFPWDTVLAFCLGEIGLSPEAMWRATPREVALMIRGRRGGDGTAGRPTEADFADLLTRYPDR